MPPNNQYSEAEYTSYLEVPSYSYSQTSSPTSCSSSSDPSSGSYRHHLLDLQSSFFHQQSLNPDPNTKLFYSHPDVYTYPVMHSTVLAPSTTEITRHLSTLRGHLVNTLTGLRYIEKQLLPSLPSHPSYPSYPSSHPTIIQEMSNAWSYYVDTNFLNELRGLTKQYPFSEELFRDARGRVNNDTRSWSMAWVMLRVMEEE
jgi:hypothetical protein